MYGLYRFLWQICLQTTPKCKKIGCRHSHYDYRLQLRIFSWRMGSILINNYMGSLQNCRSPSIYLSLDWYIAYVSREDSANSTENRILKTEYWKLNPKNPNISKNRQLWKFQLIKTVTFWTLWSSTFSHIILINLPSMQK